MPEERRTVRAADPDPRRGSRGLVAPILHRASAELAAPPCPPRSPEVWPMDTATSAATTAHRDRPSSRGALVALGLALGPVVALGFTRFAYALLLPPMRVELNWSYAAAGGMNTANAIGYIVGAAAAAWLASRLGVRRVFTAAMAVSAVALVGSGLTKDYAALTALRAVGGVTTAVVFVVGSVLASRIDTGLRPHRSAMLVAIYMAGVGVGVVLSGLIIPTALQIFGANGWPAGWIAMGILEIGR